MDQPKADSGGAIPDAPSPDSMIGSPQRLSFRAPMKAAFYGGGAATVAILAIAAVRLGAGGDFDYAASTEEAQQAILDEMASALEYGLVRSTGGAVAVREARGDARTDSLAVFAQYVDRRFEGATEDQVALARTALYQNNCNQFATRKMIAGGVAIRFAIARPSGGPLIDVQFDRQSCAPFVRASVG